MKNLGLLLLGALILSACGQSAGSPGTGSGRPELPTGIEVRFPAAPANAYLNLMTESGNSIYQLSVPEKATSIPVDSTKWVTQSANAVAIENYLPANATAKPAETKVVFLHWMMWRDANQNGKMDAGEQLDLMTHDRVVYAAQAVTAEYTTNNIHQLWSFRAGWSRAGHYVYLPIGAAYFERRFESSLPERYELHVPTPESSQ